MSRLINDYTSEIDEMILDAGWEINEVFSNASYMFYNNEDLPFDLIFFIQKPYDTLALYDNTSGVVPFQTMVKIIRKPTPEDFIKILREIKLKKIISNI